MNNVVVFGGAGMGGAHWSGQITIDGTSLGCGLMPALPNALDRSRPEHAHAVAVRVTALSCNYRDRSFIQQMRTVPASRYSPIGSEFTGEVTEVGSAVTTLRAGDRVITNHHYTGDASRTDGVREGIATNQASRRMQLLPEEKLVAIPASMPDATAAAFSLGAQTAYSMVRRLGIVAGENVLVTAGGSNTSLYLIGALRRTGAVIFVTTSARDNVARLEAAGADQVIVRPRGATQTPAEDALRIAAQEAGGFHAVADPFFDVHFEEAVQLLRPFGRYVTCGLAAQNKHLHQMAAPTPIDANAALGAAIRGNLTIMGNCIGLGTDLTRALNDFAAGVLTPVVDSVFTNGRVQEFFNRTYNDVGRFGKVVYRYDD